MADRAQRETIYLPLLLKQPFLQRRR